jgi:hypothetical protein
VLTILALLLCGAGPRPLHVTSASLEARTARDGHAIAHCTVDVEFTEAHLDALRDDEANVELSVVDRDGHGGRRLLEDLEDCRMTPDGSMRCPRGLEFTRVAPDRWRLALAFTSRTTGATFRGPLRVRFAYSVSGGPETVHEGAVTSCTRGPDGLTIRCAGSQRKERRRS